MPILARKPSRIEIASKKHKFRDSIVEILKMMPKMTSASL